MTQSKDEKKNKWIIPALITTYFAGAIWLSLKEEGDGMISIPNPFSGQTPAEAPADPKTNPNPITEEEMLESKVTKITIREAFDQILKEGYKVVAGEKINPGWAHRGEDDNDAPHYNRRNAHEILEEINEYPEYRNPNSSFTLDSTISNVWDQNTILVGSPRNNRLVAEVYGNDLARNVGIIAAYRGPTGKVAIVVTGRSMYDNTEAAECVADFQDFYEDEDFGDIDEKEIHIPTPPTKD